MNGTKIEHIWKDIICSLETCQSVTVNYTVLNLGPQQNYIFTASMLDQLNKSKTNNDSIFSEYVIFFMTCHSSCHHSNCNLSCPRTHSTVQL